MHPAVTQAVFFSRCGVDGLTLVNIRIGSAGGLWVTANGLAVWFLCGGGDGVSLHPWQRTLKSVNYDRMTTTPSTATSPFSSKLSSSSSTQAVPEKKADADGRILTRCG